MSKPLILEPSLDLAAAAPLKAALVARLDQPLVIDASQVLRLGGLCLQVLLAARRTWAEAGVSFAVSPRSAAFDQALTLFGAAARFDEETVQA